MTELSQEQRLEMEEAGITAKAAETLINAAQQGVDRETQETVKRTIREIQDVIGPHGAISRLQAGGLRIQRGLGIGVYADGLQKTLIDPEGNMFIGSDLEAAATTTACFFVNDQIYNGEEMGAGDFLMGDNSAANMFYDASEGQLQFRNATTVQAYIDTDGSIKAGGGDVSMDADGFWARNQQAAFGFEDTSGNRFKLYLYSDNTDAIGIINEIPGKAIRQTIKLTDASTPYLNWYEHPSTANLALLEVNAASTPTQVSIGQSIFLEANRDGVTTVFNEGSYDIDHRFEGATDANLLKLDAGNDRVGIGTASPGSKLDVAGTFQCDSITNDTGLSVGTYTPTLTNTTNIDGSTAHVCRYIRMNDIVFVSGQVDIDPTAVALTVLGMSLPIASTFTNLEQLSGTGSSNINAGQVGAFYADTTNHRAIFRYTPTDAVNRSMHFVFSYIIL